MIKIAKINRQAELAIRDLNDKPPYNLKVYLKNRKNYANLFDSFESTLNFQKNTRVESTSTAKYVSNLNFYLMVSIL